MTRLIAAGAALVFLVASASYLSAGTERLRPLRLKEGCVKKSDHARVVPFRASDRARLLGVSLGSGPIGIALGHESDGTLCNWMPFARTLKQHGYRVLAFDFRGWGSSPGVGGARRGRLDLDFAAAAARLRKLGAAKIVLAGASLGANAALAAATGVTPRVSAVISLSAADSTFSSRLDGDATVPKLTVAVLFMVAEGDGGFADDARKLYSQTLTVDKKLVIVPGGAHGTSILRGAAGAGPREAVLDFVRARTGWSGLNQSRELSRTGRSRRCSTRTSRGPEN
jgi:pimeloyl-ACP methyl ester carboxylesterase